MGTPAIPAPSSANSGNVYEVQPKDTGRAIAKSQGVDFKILSKLNPGVDWSHIKPGQKLVLNDSTDSAETFSRTTSTNETSKGKIYEVQENDCLSRIAKKNGSSVAEICKANKLEKTAILGSGRKIIIPASKTAEKKAAEAKVVATKANEYYKTNGTKDLKVSALDNGFVQITAFEPVGEDKPGLLANINPFRKNPRSFSAIKESGDIPDTIIRKYNGPLLEKLGKDKSGKYDDMLLPYGHSIMVPASSMTRFYEE